MDPCLWFRRNYTIDPRPKVLDVSVNARLVCLCTSNSPTCGSNENISTSIFTHERTTTIALTAIDLPRLKSGTNHPVRNNISRALKIIFLTFGVIHNWDVGHTEFSGDPPMLARFTPSCHWAVCPRREVFSRARKADWKHGLVITRKRAVKSQEGNIVVVNTVIVFRMHTHLWYGCRNNQRY